MAWRNEAILEGVLIDAVDTRFAPSGLRIAHFELEHLSEAVDLPPLERLAARASIVAAGPLAKQCADLTPGAPMRVEGALNQKRFFRSGEVRWGRIELFARRIILLDALVPCADLDSSGRKISSDPA